MLIQQRDCNDHWCENYGKDSGECDRCERQTYNRDALEERVYLQRRNEELTGNDHDDRKERGQDR